jgi:hypothetical protein
MISGGAAAWVDLAAWEAGGEWEVLGVWAVSAAEAQVV